MLIFTLLWICLHVVLLCCIAIIISISILQKGRNALHTAAHFGHLDVVKYLLPKLGERKFDKDIFGETCLDYAIQQQKQDVVDYLLTEGRFPSHQQQVSTSQSSVVL